MVQTKYLNGMKAVNSLLENHLVIILGLLIYGSTALCQEPMPIDSVVAAMEMENIEQSFLEMDKYFPSKRLPKSDQPFVFPNKRNIELPGEFKHSSNNYSTAEFLDSSYTQGLLVLENDTIVYENYWRGQESNTAHISWSIAKSYISLLFGIAMEEGYLDDLNQTVDHYLPELKGSGYEGVKIKDVLEMSSGVKFDESYSNPNSDISRWFGSFIQGKSQDSFAATLVNERKPGTYNQYVSINTHVLGMILVKVTSKSITDYMQEKIWTPMGSEYDGYWLSDSEGMEMALGGLNATLRDYAKLGQLFLRKGKWGEMQIVSSNWVDESTTPSAEHLQPDSENSSSKGIGYGYQWWIPKGDDGEILAIGVFNQYIYINPTTNTVIVKNSANNNYYDWKNPHSSTSVHLELFRKIANR